MLVALALTLLQPEPIATITAKDAAKELGLELRFSTIARLGCSERTPTQEELEWIVLTTLDPDHPDRLIRSDEQKRQLAKVETDRANHILEEFKKRCDLFVPIEDEVQLVRNSLNARDSDGTENPYYAGHYKSRLIGAILRDQIPLLDWNRQMPTSIEVGNVKVPEKYKAALAAIQRATSDTGLWEEERVRAGRPLEYVYQPLGDLKGAFDGQMKLVIIPLAAWSMYRVEVFKDGVLTGVMNTSMNESAPWGRESTMSIKDGAPKELKWPLSEYRRLSTTTERRKELAVELTEWPDLIAEMLSEQTGKRVIAWLPESMIYEISSLVFPLGSRPFVSSSDLLQIVAKWCDVRIDDLTILIRPRFVVFEEATSIQPASWQQLKGEVVRAGFIFPLRISVVLANEPWLGFLHPAEAIIGLLPIYEAARPYQPQYWLTWAAAGWMSNDNVPFSSLTEPLRQRLLRSAFVFRVPRSRHFDVQMPPNATTDWPIKSASWRVEISQDNGYILPDDYRWPGGMVKQETEIVDDAEMRVLKQGLNPNMRNVSVQLAPTQRAKLILDMGNGVISSVDAPWDHRLEGQRPLQDVLRDIPDQR